MRFLSGSILASTLLAPMVWSGCGLVIVPADDDDTIGQGGAGGGAVDCGGEPCPEGLTAITAGVGHSCELRDGRPLCWGDNTHGQISNAPEGVLFVQLSAGDDHTCGVDIGGLPHCWGDDVPAVTQTPTDLRVREIRAGADATCALREEDGAIVCWGDPQASVVTPPKGSFANLDVGYGYGCALTTDGRAVCWGEEPEPEEPWLVLDAPTDLTFTEVGVGEDHACGLRADNGQFHCWGNPDYAEPATEVGVPVTSLSVGDYTCGIRQDNGSVLCVTPWADLSPPLDYAAAVVSGASHSCAMWTSNTVSCWGFDFYGQASGAKDDTPLSLLSVYDNHCGMAQDGTVRCFGGEWGGKSELIPSEPVSALALGDEMVCGQPADGSALWCLDAYVPGGSFIQLDAAIVRVCGVRAANGQITCWDKNNAFSPPLPVATYTQVSTTDVHT